MNHEKKTMLLVRVSEIHKKQIASAAETKVRNCDCPGPLVLMREFCNKLQIASGKILSYPFIKTAVHFW